MSLFRGLFLLVLLPFLSSPVNNDEPQDWVIEYRIAIMNRASPFPMEYNPDVAYFIDLYLGERLDQLKVFLQRKSQYFPLIESLFREYQLPTELKYLAMLESGLNPEARSSTGALGLWQFKSFTAAHWGLLVNDSIDQRKDPELSTRAACKYLTRLYKEFNDWRLVLAAYNSGPITLKQAMEKSGTTEYWILRSHLPEQSQRFVPAFIALYYLGENYGLHGINFEAFTGAVPDHTGP